MDAMTGNSTGVTNAEPAAPVLGLPLLQRVTRIIGELALSPREQRTAETIARLAINGFDAFAQEVADDAAALGEAFNVDRVVYAALIAATFRTNERRKDEVRQAREELAAERSVAAAAAA